MRYDVLLQTINRLAELGRDGRAVLEEFLQSDLDSVSNSVRFLNGMLQRSQTSQQVLSREFVWGGLFWGRGDGHSTMHLCGLTRQEKHVKPQRLKGFVLNQEPDNCCVTRRLTPPTHHLNSQDICPSVQTLTV